MMIINYGPAANHNHLDVLDFEIYANGKAIAVDAGIGPKGYDDELQMNWYRASPSHNMVVVDDSNIVRGETGVRNVVERRPHNVVVSQDEKTLKLPGF